MAVIPSLLPVLEVLTTADVGTMSLHFLFVLSVEGDNKVRARMHRTEEVTPPTACP